MAFVYGLVAHGAVPLAEYSPSTGNFKSVAIRLLENIDSKKQYHVLQSDPYVFHSFTDNNRMNYLCLTEKTASAQLRIAFLEELNRKWTSKYGTQGAKFTSYSKQKEFGPEIQALFTTYNSERAQKIANIKGNIAQAQEKMTENLTEALIRGEKLEVMEEKANNIKENAQVFHRKATAVKRKMCWEKYRWYVAGVIIVLVIIFILILIFCNGFKFQCGKSDDANK